MMQQTFGCGRRRPGFTLVELIVVLTVVAAMLAAAYPLYSFFYTERDLDATGSAIVQTLREAQMRAMSSDGGRPWGVQFDDGSGGGVVRFTLFRGSSFASRDAAYDLVTNLDGDLAFSMVGFLGGDAVVFDRARGTTANTGSVTLTSAEGDPLTVSVNAAGTINIE